MDGSVGRVESEPKRDMTVIEKFLVSRRAFVTSLPRFPVAPTIATVLMVTGDDISMGSVEEKLNGIFVPMMMLESNTV